MVLRAEVFASELIVLFGGRWGTQLVRGSGGTPGHVISGRQERWYFVTGDYHRDTRGREFTKRPSEMFRILRVYAAVRFVGEETPGLTH